VKSKLLVIDDDLDLVTSVTAVMEGAGWEVHSAPNGVAGMERAREQIPDLIILDVLMPRQDGLTTYEQLRRDPALRSVPIIVLTSVSEKLGIGLSGQDMRTYYGHGPEAFLQKPFEPQNLLATVTRLTGRSV
jgi:two-component system response regulator RpaA